MTSVKEEFYILAIAEGGNEEHLGPYIYEI